MLGERSARAGFFAAVRAVLAAVARAARTVGRAVRFTVRELPLLVWRWLASNAARVAAVAWLAGLAAFVGVASVRTWHTVADKSRSERARLAERDKQRAAIQALEFKDIDEMEGEKQRQLSKYGAEFDTMVTDAGPPTDAAPTGGGIAGWVERNKKHVGREVSDEETLKLLREEMGEEFGAIAELAAVEGEPGSVAGTLQRMKQISQLRGGQGSQQPTEALLAEMAKQGFDQDLMGTAVAPAGPGDAQPAPTGTAAADPPTMGGTEPEQADPAPRGPSGEHRGEAGEHRQREAGDDGQRDDETHSDGELDGDAPRELVADQDAGPPPPPEPVAVAGFDVQALGDAAASGFSPVLEALTVALAARGPEPAAAAAPALATAPAPGAQPKVEPKPRRNARPPTRGGR